MAHLQIEINKKNIKVNGRIWSSVKKGIDLGHTITNVLFYTNPEGNNTYTLLINGVDETQNFKKEVEKRYKNTGLNYFLNFCNIK